MSLYKRGCVWWCNIRAPDGTRFRRSLRTEIEADALKLYKKLNHEVWNATAMDERPKRSFDEAALRWLREMEHKRSIDSDRLKIAKLRPLFKGIALDRITGDLVKTTVMKFDVAPATRNRYLALIRAMLRKAEREWGWIERAPSFSMYKEAKRRIRWLTPAEAQVLLRELPEHWKGLVQFALATGLRKSNVFLLRWDQIDMQRRVAWIHPDEAKAGKGIGVPLNQTAVSVITSRLGEHDQFVFTYRGHPMRVDSDAAWKSALVRAGIRDFRFHDLRHTWASWHVQNGTGLAELQEMGGWESTDMVRRYAHLAPDHLHGHASKLDSLLSAPTGTFLVQQEKRPDAVTSGLSLTA